MICSECSASLLTFWTRSCCNHCEPQHFGQLDDVASHATSSGNNQDSFSLRKGRLGKVQTHLFKTFPSSECTQWNRSCHVWRNSSWSFADDAGIDGHKVC